MEESVARAKDSDLLGAEKACLCWMAVLKEEWTRACVVRHLGRRGGGQKQP